jgi:mRNA interferase RelE/StbE
MTFEITYDKQPVKFLKKLDKNIAKRILDKIDDVFINGPVPSDAKRIIGEHGVFRIRIGDHRILYRIEYEKQVIVLFKIDKRENVYD